MPESPPSTPPHTTTQLPQGLMIEAPDDQTPEDADKWYTVPLDSGMPLNCAVALNGGQLASGNGTMVCYLMLIVGKSQGSMFIDPPTRPYYIERSNVYTASACGRATLSICMCFYTATSYLISVGMCTVYRMRKGWNMMGTMYLTILPHLHSKYIIMFMLIFWQDHERNITPSVKKQILHLFDYAIADSVL